MHSNAPFQHKIFPGKNVYKENDFFLCFIATLENIAKTLSSISLAHKIINISYRLSAGLGERTNGSGLKDSSGGSDRISNGCGEGDSGHGDGFRSKKK